MSNHWDFPSISTYRGPRSFEVPYVLNNIEDGSILEIGANKSLLKWAILRRGEKYTLIDPLGTEFKGAEELDHISQLTGDIRKQKSRRLGKFDNVILMSTLEHIGLPGYRQKENWKKWGSKRKAQLWTFRHCMSFVKDNGIMICTLPYKRHNSTINNNLIRYSRQMVDDLQKGFTLVDEKIFAQTDKRLDRWMEVKDEETNKRRANICFVIRK